MCIRPLANRTCLPKRNMPWSYMVTASEFRFQRCTFTVQKKKINTAMHFVKESLHSLFSCFHGYIISGSTLVCNALVLNVHLEHITQSMCISIRNMINNWNESVHMSNDWLTFRQRPWPQSRSNIILCANKIALRTLTLIVIYFFRAIEKS